MSEKLTEESSIGGQADAAGSASGAASLGASASSKKTQERTQEKKKPKKLGQKPEGEQITANGEADEGVGESAPSTPQSKMDQKERSQSRRASRGRGRQGSQPPSDTDSAYRSDVSQKGGRRNRNRNRGKAQTQVQEEQGGGGPLQAVDELGETVNGVTDGAQDLVSNTAGKALSAPTEALGGLVGKGKGKGKGGKGGQQVQGQEEEKEEEGQNEQLRLRLDVNLDIEVQLKARIHGDLTIGLLN